MHPALFTFDNSYARLPEAFYARLAPAPVAAPRLIAFNRALAADLGMRHAPDETLAQAFAGNLIPEGAEPMALAYAGHQFGHFVPSLGDGRAILLGEVKDARGRRRDIQLKGSGRTAFSRQGDGRAALGPVIREYIVSEAMHALGIPTTRSLAAVTTGEQVRRETALPGGIVTRVAASHLRVGTFEYFAARGDMASVKLLADYAIDRHYPEAKTAPNPYEALLAAVTERQGRLVAGWLHVGFIHGVMNTDNMAISGETIDYGPCAFMDAYDPMTVYSFIDRFGRYAFANQPPIAQWNLTRLAETLAPLMDADIAQAIGRAEALLAGFRPLFERFWLAGMRSKLGLLNDEAEDETLAQDWLKLLHQGSADYTLSFRRLADAQQGDEALAALFTAPYGLAEWLTRWRARLARQNATPTHIAQVMHSVNPLYIPRNHLVEQAIVAAVEREDFSVMHRLGEALAEPYSERAGYEPCTLPPLPQERVEHTFCGT